MKRRIQKIANSVARKNGYGSASEITIGSETRVVSHTRYGFRKYSTDEYVSNSYRKKFGWKNTYYQNAITHVELSAKDLGLA